MTHEKKATSLVHPAQLAGSSTRESLLPQRMLGALKTLVRDPVDLVTAWFLGLNFKSLLSPGRNVSTPYRAVLGGRGAR